MHLLVQKHEEVRLNWYICSEFVIVLLEPYVALEEDKVKHAG